MSSADKSKTPKHPKRRLAAVVAADVVAYSRLMGADEEGTLESLKAHRRDLINPKIIEHKGRIVKTTGDGILIEFPSVVDALRCATEVQLGMIERNVDVAREKRIEFRAGVNVGDIILDEGDIYGDGVNIAARLENLAEPGTVYISGAVFDQVRNKLPLRYDCLGEQHVKNISEAVRVYRVHPSSTSRAPSLLRRGSWLVSGITHTMLRIFVASVALTAITNAARRSRCYSADGC
jgi:class 3 adenylate cyclase